MLEFNYLLLAIGALLVCFAHAGIYRIFDSLWTPTNRFYFITVITSTYVAFVVLMICVL